MARTTLEVSAFEIAGFIEKRPTAFDIALMHPVDLFGGKNEATDSADSSLPSMRGMRVGAFI